MKIIKLLRYAKMGFLILLLVKSSIVLADGLPGEYMLSDKWRQAYESSSPIDNPALMMELPYVTLRGVLAISSGDPARLWELGAIIPLNLYNTIAFTITAENGGEIKNSFFEGDSIVRGETTHNNNLMFTGSYGVNPMPKLSIGANVNVAYQADFGNPSWGLGADIGVGYHIVNSPYAGNHLISLNYKNLYSPDFNKSMPSLPYSSQLQMLYHVSLLKNKLRVDYKLSFNDFTSKKTVFSSGSQKFDWDMAFQVGVTPFANLNILAFTDINHLNSFGSFGIAAGIDLQRDKNGKVSSFLYQYRQNLKTDLIGMHSIYGSAEIGKHREELYAIKMAQKSKYCIYDLYNKAMRLYTDKHYWDAFFTFVRLQKEYPLFFKIDAVSYYAANCLEKLDMRQEAIDLYNEVKKMYISSSYVSLSDLGIMRLYYRDGKIKDMEDMYLEMISQSNVSDSVKLHAFYYMGESELIIGNYQKAYEYLNSIDKKHPAYTFAQHSLATVEEFLGNKKEKVMEHLINVIENAQSSNSAEKEILNRSLVLLGYMYYEEQAMAKAVVALRMVSPESYYYEDALLGLGWAAVKSKQWNDCISVGEKLFRTSRKKIIKSEADLLMAYGYLQTKQLDKAEDALHRAVKRVENHDDSLSEIIFKTALTYDHNRLAYDSIAKNVLKFSKSDIWDINNKKIEALHEGQILAKNNLDQSISAADEYKRTLFFERSLTKLTEDIEYALATVLKIRSAHKDDESKNDKKKQKIDNQIDELKRKMEKLQ